ncbi:hypothetical protein [Roseibium aestuarii]|uniref:Lipoyl-binding domain-containing protein n=1 Tax=Roseibium aestuarii TaxID=2600299 RepID=A0ABW4JQ15_9HYPH|nr:hypothetical protein [Roseibium aestuarii]
MPRLIEIFSPRDDALYPLTVSSLPFTAGDTVRKGEIIVVITGPEQERKIRAPMDGWITAVNFEAGTRLNLRSPLLRMEVADEATRDPQETTSAAPRNEPGPAGETLHGATPPPTATARPDTEPGATSGKPVAVQPRQSKWIRWGGIAATLAVLWLVTPATRFSLLSGGMIPLDIAVSHDLGKIWSNVTGPIRFGSGTNGQKETRRKEKPDLRRSSGALSLTCQGTGEAYWQGSLLTGGKPIETRDDDVRGTLKLDYDARKACIDVASYGKREGKTTAREIIAYCVPFEISGDTLYLSDDEYIGGTSTAPTTLGLADLRMLYDTQKEGLDGELERAETFDLTCRAAD